MSQFNPPEVLPSMVCGPESFGVCCSLVVWSIDQSCMVFGPGFPYKLGQLSSSNKNSGKHKLSPYVKKNALYLNQLEDS
jgi:hypothetical protein